MHALLDARTITTGLLAAVIGCSFGCRPSPPSQAFVRLTTQDKLAAHANTTATVVLRRSGSTARRVVVAYNRFATLLADPSSLLPGGSAMAWSWSEDDGDHWTSGTVYHSPPAGTNYGSPALATSGSFTGGPWPAVHYASIGGTVGPTGDREAQEIVYARSDDGAAGFGGAVVAAQSSMHVRQCNDSSDECQLRNCGRYADVFPPPDPLWNTADEPTILVTTARYRWGVRDYTAPRVDIVFVSDRGTDQAALQHVYGYVSPIPGDAYGMRWCRVGTLPLRDDPPSAVRHPMIRLDGSGHVVVLYEVHRDLGTTIGNATAEYATRLAVIELGGSGPLWSHSYLTDGSPGGGRTYYIDPRAVPTVDGRRTAVRAVADARVFAGSDRDIEIVWIANDRPQDMVGSPWPAVYHQAVGVRVVRLPGRLPVLSNDYAPVTTVRSASSEGPGFQPTLTGVPGGFGTRSVSFVQQSEASTRAHLVGISRLGPSAAWSGPRNLTAEVRGGGPDMPLCSTLVFDWGERISSTTLFGFFPGTIQPVDPRTGQPLPPFVGPLPYVVNLTFHVDSGGGECMPTYTALAAGRQEIAMTRWAP